MVAFTSYFKVRDMSSFICCKAQRAPLSKIFIGIPGQVQLPSSVRLHLQHFPQRFKVFYCRAICAAMCGYCDAQHRGKVRLNELTGKIKVTSLLEDELIDSGNIRFP